MKTATPSETLLVLLESDVGMADSAQCAEILTSVAGLRSWLDAYEAGVTLRLGELHEQHGAASPIDVHTDCSGVSAGEARRRQHRADVIGRVPRFGEALAAGRIGTEHVDALANATAKLTDDVGRRLFDRADELLALAESLSPTTFGRRVRERARRLERDGGTDRDQQQRNETFLSRKQNPRTGMIEGRFSLHPELANQVFGAVDCEVAAMIAEGERSGNREIISRAFDRNRLAAEALGRLVAGGHQQRRPLEADITVIIDDTTLTSGDVHDHTVCETGDGVELPPASVHRLLCQGRVTPVIVDTDGVVITAGRTIRNANRAQRRALRAMYRTCAFGECDVPFGRCDIHHIVPWERGGQTDLENLIPLCSRHHHLLHDHAWTLDLSTDRTLTIRHADGTVYAVARPDVMPVPAPAVGKRRRTAA